jgi:simple sugar transport system ATP-binding protein
MRGITKRFPGVLANDCIDFSVEEGEIHALLGENGAGKTTLMNILYGFYQPDEGEIFVRGQKADIRSPYNAIVLGLGMVHQQFQLVPPFTVAENIVLGMQSSREPFLDDPRKLAERITEYSERFGLKVDPHRRIWELSVGEQQRVEILKALYRGADLLILDEPTAVLTPQETESLFTTVFRRLMGARKSIIFITHKLKEVFAVATRITVLRDGRVVDTVAPSDTTKEELARMMVGREVFLKIDKMPPRRGDVALKAEGLCATDDRGLPALKHVSLRVRQGEILGIAGVDGNGQRELEEVLTGLRPTTEGRLVVLGRGMTGASPARIMACGVGHIPSDRTRMGLVADLSVAENAVLGEVEQPPFTQRGLLDQRAIEDHAQRLIAEYDVRVPGPAVAAGKLSGGNAQKLVLARELARSPRIIVAAQPTRGLDVGATEYVRQKLIEQRDNGMAVLLISTELEEILSLSDRIAVMYEGEIVGLAEATGVTVEELGLMMAGARKCLPERREQDKQA